jgi:threonyl-tRNA synthetase
MRRSENARRGYVEVKTPLIYDKVLWERSGHWEKFREHMFLIPEEDHLFAIKPMNCPGHMTLFAEKLRSYRELPLRYAEAAPLHRNEPSGTLHGLTRVRHVTQDDAHIFCTREQIEDEIFGCLDYAKFIYDLFELESDFELSTRPDNKLGTDEEWDFTEGALRAALERLGLEYTVNEGDGAFYGPKIDLHMRDSLGRSWQMGTIQLDSQQPGRLNCRYVGADNAEHVPYVVHRALMGSFERFIGILTEHYAGAFPFWLAPVQIRVIPVGESHRPAAAALAGRLEQYRVEVDDSDETVGKRIRNAEIEKIPFVVVYGDKESDESLAVRERGGEQSTLALAEFQDKLATLGVWQAGTEPSLTSWREASGVQPSEVD